MHILIVEDEKRLADTLKELLEKNRFTADVAYDGEDGLYFAQNAEYDAIVLDLMLPKISGFEVLSRLRSAKNPTPVIILTAMDSVNDKVKGLDLGADDYLTKPFSSDELLARIRAIARRKGEVVISELEFADLKLDLSNYTLSLGKKSIHLGAKEFGIMQALMSAHGVIPKETLIVKIWGGDSDATDNSLEAYMSFLRKKLAFLGSCVQIISARKQGYYLSKGGETE